MILALQVMHHVKHVRKSIKNISNTLAKNGLFIIRGQYTATNFDLMYLEHIMIAIVNGINYDDYMKNSYFNDISLEQICKIAKRYNLEMILTNTLGEHINPCGTYYAVFQKKN
jgi:hypothetical protein